MYKLLKNLIEMDDYSVQRFVTGGSKKLPDGYIKADYIESNGTQYIDTGLIGTDLSDSEIELTIKNNTTGLNEYNFNGAYQTGKITQMGTVATSDTTCRCTINFGFTEGAGANGLDITKFHKLYAKNGVQKVNNAQVDTKNFGSLNEYPFLLFARTNIIGTTPTIDFNKGSSISSFWIKKNGKYVRNLVPAVKKGSKNLFDESTAVLGKYIDGNGVERTSSTGENNHSDYIPIKSGVQYTLAETKPSYNGIVSAIAWYTSAKVFIQRDSATLSSLAGRTSNTWTAPSNAVYAIINFYRYPEFSGENDMLNEGTEALPYEEYSQEQIGMYDLNATSKNLWDEQLENGTLNENASPIGSTYQQCKGATVSQRVRSINVIHTNGVATISFNNTKYNLYVLFFDNDALYTGRYEGWKTGTFTVNSPYIGIVVKPISGNISPDADDFNIMINSGSTALPYEPYQKRFYTNDGTGEFGYEYNGEKKDPTS